MGVRLPRARQADVLRLASATVRDSPEPASLIGCIGALIHARVMQSLMKDAAQFDLLAFVLSTLLLVGTALLGVLYPRSPGSGGRSNCPASARITSGSGIRDQIPSITVCNSAFDSQFIVSDHDPVR